VAAPPNKQQCVGTHGRPVDGIQSSAVVVISRIAKDLMRSSMADIGTAQSRRPEYSSIFTIGEASAIMSRFLQWFFRNRETGDITIAQAPNLVLWVVIVAGALRWIWQPPGNAAIALDIVFKGGLIVWALDEIFRGVNPWRRCLGGAVLAYELTTFL
jgi:hypothetical protein